MKNPSRLVRAVLFFAILGAIIFATVYSAGGAIHNMLTSPSERYRQEGDVFLADGRLSEAVLAYRQSVEADRKNSAALRSLSAAYQNQGRLRMAQRYAAMVDPTSAPPAPEPSQSSYLKLKWILPASDSVPTGGCLQGNVLVASYEDGLVAALNPEDGKSLWTIHLNAAITSAPAASLDSVWIGTMDGLLHRLSLIDGSVQWMFATRGPIYAPPLISGDRVYLPSGDGSLYALSLADGSKQWSFETRGQLHATPVLLDGRLFFGSTDGKFYAVSAESGRPVWQDGILTSGAVEAPALAVNGRVIFGSGDGRVYALAPDTGGQYWRYSTPDSVFTAPVLAENTVYIASSGRSLSAVDFTSGKRLWQVNLPSPLRSSPVVFDKFIFQIADGDPNLYVIERATGKLLETVNTGDWTGSGPWINGDSLFLLGKDGAVIAYKLLQ